ncbi:DUF3078 domain-containing protein [Melioribacteraceae bacterium 4301-Me]|uniref:DUF3078 domain-containing protein n=1 Tax=Pyranulibacter aquaticus TaxID=3163344 RepID=UPI00359AF54E
MKGFILCLILISLTEVMAQETKKDTLNSKWIPSLTTGINISQIAFSNWAKGGDNSISWTILTNFTLTKHWSSWTLRSNLKAVYGRSKIGSNTYKTTNNDFYWEKVLSYNVGWSVDPYLSNTIRTQISKGYDYKINPNGIQISDFWDPGYVTQSIGFTYDRLKNFKTRLGIAFQETFTKKFKQYSDNPNTADEIESFKFETGVESASDLQLKLDTNLIWDSKFRLFTRFERLNVWDVLWDNTITAKINSWLNVNFTYTVLYEKSQSTRTQIKEALQLGFTYTIL